MREPGDGSGQSGKAEGTQIEFSFALGCGFMNSLVRFGFWLSQ
jgi:hypothetical protein